MKTNRMLLLVLLATVGTIQAQNIDAKQSKTGSYKSVKPKVFIVSDITVHDSVIYEQYRIKAEKVIKDFGGQYLVRSGGMSFDNNAETKIIPIGAGKWNPDRFIILQFDSIEQYQKFVKSDEYIEVAKLRTSSSTAKSIIVKEYVNDKK